ncbi:MAG: hypothetical protein EOO39_08375 [Cytophagaceae bacterium]|nr:MAG: hypothetical protein EOO39_08375 [Cytophagaceae bacterium]
MGRKRLSSRAILEMPVTNYDTVNGYLQGESTGGVQTDYLTDALGSIVAVVNSIEAVVNAYRYKPYGDLLDKTGVGVDPRFLWTGSTGSRTTGLVRTEQYNRRRHYSSSSCLWTTVDPLWPEEWAYVYVGGNPVRFVDPSGLAACQRVCELPPPNPPICGTATVYFLVPTGDLWPLTRVGYRESKTCYFEKQDMECCVNRKCIKVFDKLYLPPSGFLDEVIDDLCSDTAKYLACGLACAKLKNPYAVAACTLICGAFLKNKVPAGQLCKNLCRRKNGSRCFKYYLETCAPARQPIPVGDIQPQCASPVVITHAACC